MEKISVIVPFYNVEKYADRCINSIVKQTYKNLEIILVDDGSKDNSGKICENWKNKDNRIIVLHKKNGGLSDARNAGIKIATGEYIAFIDSDDYIDYDMLNTLYDNLKKTSSEISICKFKQTDEKSKVEFKKSTKLLEYSREEAIKELLQDKDITNHAWNKLYKKELFSDIEYPKGRNFEDIGTTYKLFSKCKKIVYTPSECYAYIIRENSITGSVSEKSLLDQVFQVKQRYDFIEQRYNLNKYNLINRIYFIFRYHMSICKFLTKKVLYKEEIIDEYKFFKKNYKEVKSEIKDKKFLYNLLFYNRILFWYVVKILYRIKGVFNENT